MKKRNNKQSGSIVFFDIDGCLSDHTKRLHLVKPVNSGETHTPENYREYNEALLQDPPITQNVERLHQHLERGDTIVISTARPIMYAEQTVIWLHEQAGVSVGEYQLCMRPEGDLSEAPFVKAKHLREIVARNKFSGFKVIAAYDDLNENLMMFANNKIPAILANKDGIAPSPFSHEFDPASFDTDPNEGRHDTGNQQGKDTSAPLDELLKRPGLEEKQEPLMIGHDLAREADDKTVISIAYKLGSITFHIQVATPNTFDLEDALQIAIRGAKSLNN